MLKSLGVIADSKTDADAAAAFSKKYAVPLLGKGSDAAKEVCAVHVSGDRLYVSWPSGKKRLILDLDFSSGGADHRRKFGGGKGQLIAKAIGVGATKQELSVFDCTAGQGSDAFVLACLGCRVHMCERSFVAYALLQNALERGMAFARTEDSELLDILQRMTLELGDARVFLENAERTYDVIYVDPMFPARKKSALVKKEMQLFHQLIGDDSDSTDFLARIRSFAKYRLVVKRPKGAPHLNDETPTFELKSKSIRYDIYVNKSLSSGA